MGDNTDKVYDMVEEANKQMLILWKENIVFTWRWWLGVILTVLPWILWIIFRKKECTHRLLYAGIWILTISSFLDFVGVCLGAWQYHWKVLPLIISYIPWDFSLIPVTVMLFVQSKPDINPFIKAVLFAAFAAFVGETTFQWLGMYEPERWKHIYSFIIYIPVYLLGDYMSKREHFTKLS